jgi:hypothetical protein
MEIQIVERMDFIVVFEYRKGFSFTFYKSVYSKITGFQY